MPPTAKEVSMLRFIKKALEAYVASAEKFGPFAHNGLY